MVKILAIICAIIGISLVVTAIYNLHQSDPWGLGFTFFILPLLIIGLLFLILAYYLYKSIEYKKENRE